MHFGALLAATADAGPSVLQIRVRAPLPEANADHVLAAMLHHGRALEQGALVTLDPLRSRVRILPIRARD